MQLCAFRTHLLCDPVCFSAFSVRLRALQHVSKDDYKFCRLAGTVQLVVPLLVEAPSPAQKCERGLEDEVVHGILGLGIQCCDACLVPLDVQILPVVRVGRREGALLLPMCFPAIWTIESSILVCYEGVQESF